MSSASCSAPGFHFDSSAGCCSDAYLLPQLKKLLKQLPWAGSEKQLFDLGCGNGAIAYQLSKDGFTVTGVDPSEQGIAFANQAHPELKLHVGSAYDDLAKNYGQFPVVISMEVVEHVYSPRLYAKCLRDLIQPGGHAIVSTPYHGYWKNLALAITGRFDKHFSPLWDHGHIKFWSIASLTELFREVGLVTKNVARVGRIPILAKTMVFLLHRPA